MLAEELKCSHSTTSCFANTPISKPMKIIKTRLQNYATLTDRMRQQINDMELLDFVLTQPSSLSERLYTKQMGHCDSGATGSTQRVEH